MTVSSTPCSKNALPERRRFLRRAAVCAFALALAPQLAWAGQPPRIRYAALQPSEEQYLLDADIELDFGALLRELVNAGVALFFVAEFIVTRDRWYWLDETVIERVLSFRLSYHALTRNYRLAVGGLHQSFETLDEAVSTMLRIRSWTIIERNRLRGGRSYDAALRFRLDLTQMPKPFQVQALGNKELMIETDWLAWTFLAAPSGK